LWSRKSYKNKNYLFLAAKYCHDADEQYQSAAELKLALVTNDIYIFNCSIF
jgi:hypothetical protein